MSLTVLYIKLVAMGSLLNFYLYKHPPNARVTDFYRSIKESCLSHGMPYVLIAHTFLHPR